MPTLSKYTYGYRRGRRVSSREVANDSERRERERQRARPAGWLTLEGRVKPRAAGAQQVENQ